MRKVPRFECVCTAREANKEEKKKVREGQTVDALALGGEEGRDKLRKAWGRCK